MGRNMKMWEIQNVVQDYIRYIKCTQWVFNRLGMGWEKFSELKIALSEILWFEELTEKEFSNKHS